MRLSDNTLRRGKDTHHILDRGLTTTEPSRCSPMERQQQTVETNVQRTSPKTIANPELTSIPPLSLSSIFPKSSNLSALKPTRRVRFATYLEDIRHFNVDDPSISVQSEPVTARVVPSTYRNLEALNFCSPDKRQKAMPVHLRKIDLSSDGAEIQGIVEVANLAFRKIVAVRFTTDQWQTVSELLAEYHSTSDHLPNHDEFRFDIDIESMEGKTLFLCVRYSVNYDEFWDNNENLNYHIAISPFTRQKQQRPPRAVHTAFSHPLSWTADTGDTTVEYTGSAPHPSTTRLVNETIRNEEASTTRRKPLVSSYCLEQSFALISKLNSPDIVVKPETPRTNSCFSRLFHDELDQTPICGH